MIKNVIFDIGNVLAKFRYKEYIEELGIPCDKRERVAKATAEGPYWALNDKGVLTAYETMINCISLDYGAEAEIRLFFKDMERLVMEYPDSCDWVNSVKAKGKKVYILSNYSRENFLMMTDKFKFLKLMDGQVISYEERLLKPDPEIYKVLLSRYGLEPTECVFLDDSRKNVEGAEALGIKGIVVEDRREAMRELEELLKE